jgi:transmembrane sensor
MSEQELTTLWSGYVSNRMTAEERQRFSELAVAEAHHEQLEELVAAFLREHQPRIKPYTDKQQVFEAIMAEALRREEHAVAATVVPIRSFSRSWKWAAAILLMATSAAVYFILHEEKSPPVAYTYHYAQQTAHKVLLTLDDGAPVVLDTISGGQPGTQTNASISKGVLAYQKNSNGQKAGYNTLSTSSGALYQLVLSDGTKVWLNAWSSIRYPTAFNEKDRLVTVSGEAYFDIAPDAEHPFIVKTDSMRIHVLGTRFNIRAYKEEHLTKTTLLQGSVHIFEDGQNKGYPLLPGEQSTLQAGNVKKVKLPDTDAVVAWMHGEFNFESADIAMVFGEIGRWYGMDVRLEPTVRQHHFTGIIPREYSVTEVLTALQIAGIEYHIAGNTIVVTK